MNYVEHKFDGKTNRLSLTAGALYKIYDKFGYTESIISTLKLDDRSEESWKNTCWIYALLASQGELQRRAMGYDAEPMISMSALEYLASPADVPNIKSAIHAAIQLGFTRHCEPSEDAEVDLVLKELEIEEKKKEAGGVNDFFSSLVQLASLSLAQKKQCSSVPENFQT